MRTIGILLAAGSSRRMKKAKQLIQIGHKPLIIYSLDTLLESHLAKVILVLGHHHQEILKHIPTSEKLATVINNNYVNGMGSSIKTAMAHLKPNTDAVMIALADQPFITSDLINILIKYADATTKNIIAPICNGKRGHPVIFKKKYFQELLKLTGDKGGHFIVKKHPYDILLVDVATDSILIDIDTPKDLESALMKFTNQHEHQ